MNFSVSSSGVAGVNAYTGYKNNTFGNNFINQEYDFGDNPNYYNEVASNSIVFSEYEDELFRQIGKGVFASSYAKNFFYILVKDGVWYADSFLKPVFDSTGGKALYASFVRSLWYVGTIFIGGKQFNWKDLLNEGGISSFGKTVFSASIKKGVERGVNRFSTSLHESFIKNYPQYGLKPVEELIEKMWDDPAIYDLLDQYEILENNLYRANNIFDDLYKSGGYIYEKIGPRNWVKTGTAGSFSGSMSQIGEYVRKGKPDFAKYFSNASSAMFGKIGAATGVDYVASLVVNLGKGLVNWDTNASVGANIGRVFSVSSMKYGSTLLTSSWKAICGTAGESIGFAIGGPTGAKIGKCVGTLVGAEIGTFVVELFDGKEGWCAAAGVAAIGGAVAGGAIATALVVGAEVSLAFPVGTIIGVAIIAGAIVATAVVWVGYLIFG